VIVPRALIASSHGAEALRCRAPVVPIFTCNLIAYVLSFPELDAYSRVGYALRATNSAKRLRTGECALTPLERPRA
jgi:hypothetical protein